NWSILRTRTGNYDERANIFSAEGFKQINSSSRIDVHRFLWFVEGYRRVTLRGEMEYAIWSKRRDQPPQPLEVPNIAMFERHAFRCCGYGFINVKAKHGAACLHAVLCQI